jgi:hypothetical protein
MYGWGIFYIIFFVWLISEPEKTHHDTKKVHQNSLQILPNQAAYKYIQIQIIYFKS